jgi:hypothetical protein
MRERTFIASMIGLDVLLILAGGAMAWSRALPSRVGLHGRPSGPSISAIDLVNGSIVTVLVAGIGAYVLYELNVRVLRLAETASPERSSAILALVFALVALAGGVAALVAG